VTRPTLATRLGATAPKADGTSEPLARAKAGFHGTRRTTVRGLLLHCRIGIHPQERVEPQRVRIDIELLSPEPAAHLSDKIKDTINYEKLVKRVKEIALAGHVNLVETLAGRIADHCCQTLPVERVVVRVQKIDVIPEAEAVGVEVQRIAAARLG
jgi:dihydroneopterin aldolase